MSGSVNKVILVGYLGKDPEVKYFKDKPVCNFSIATNEEWKDKAGEKQKKTEWHNIQAWGKLAEICGEYLAKGKQCYVEGKIQTRKWTDDNGVDRWTTSIVANSVVFIGSKGDSGGNRQPEPPPLSDDDLPI